MRWDNKADICVQSGDDESDVGVECGDKEGTWIGYGVWVGNVWHDLIDPLPFPQRQSRSREDFDPDYQQNPSQAMTMRLLQPSIYYTFS